MDREEIKNELEGKVMVIDGEHSLTSMTALFLDWLYSRGYEVIKIKKERKSKFMEEWWSIKSESTIISSELERNEWRLNRLAELIDKHKADKFIDGCVKDKI